MNKRILSDSVCGVAVLMLMLLLLGASSGFAQHRAINPNKSVSHAPYSQGIVAGNTLYVAGLQGTDLSGKFPSGGFAAQTRSVLENIRRVVEAAGFQMKDVVSVNVYLTDIHDFAAMNKIYAGFFPDPKPTRTTVQVAALSNGALIEISAIAVREGRVQMLPAGAH